MNTAYKSEKSLFAAILAVIAVSAIVLAAVPAAMSDADTAVDKEFSEQTGLPQRNIDFDVTLGYDYYPISEVAPACDYSKFWTVSFDFSESILEGKAWPYRNQANMAVTFFFSDGASNIISSKQVCYQVFEVDGMPYVEDIVCTPDLWPNVNGQSAYPVYVEAFIYYYLDAVKDTH